ncbi:hypothetical protein TNCV_3963931 [Trichonephila clavipes]|nr:hypothetical protein TNCV_3963931 [Trichonephila clavipes]
MPDVKIDDNGLFEERRLIAYLNSNKSEQLVNLQDLKLIKDEVSDILENIVRSYRLHQQQVERDDIERRGSGNVERKKVRNGERGEE